MVQDDDDPASLLTTNNKPNKHWSTVLLTVVVIVTSQVSGSVASEITRFTSSDTVGVWCSGDRQLVHLALSLQKCAEPFLAETKLQVQCNDAHILQDAANSLLAELLLHQYDVSVYNKTYNICVRPTNQEEWMELSLFFVPPNNDANMGSGQQWSDDNDVSTDTNSYQMTGDEGLFKDYLEPGSESTNVDWSGSDSTNENWILNRVRRQGDSPMPRVLDLKLTSVSAKTSYQADGRIESLEGEDIELIIVGINLSNTTNIKLTTSAQNYSDKCGDDKTQHTKTSHFTLQTKSLQDGYARVLIPGSEINYFGEGDVYFVCVQDPNTKEYIHQGQNNALQISVYVKLLPTWLSVIMICVLLCLSGLFSGLNLGLMSLDQTELRIVMNTGSEKEKAYAKAIMPIRGMGNFLLCSILLGNVLVNNSLTILLDSLTGGGGIVAVIGATLGIVVFGEIIPQAICSRHGLAVGANTIWLTKFFMLVTAPLSYPISMLLDKLLGAEIGTVYNRERLMELIKVTDAYTDLEKDEVQIVTGALVLKKKTVKDVMTKLDDCYMLPINTLLNFETVSEIKDQGYSRIPVYEGDRSNVKHILFAKDLLFIDPDDNKPLEEICKFYKNDVNLVYQDTALNDMFDEFKSGEKGHMAMVQEANTEGDGDPYYETVGLLTLEDIIEEIIQQEINDETDVILDNKTKKKRKKQRATKDADFRMFLESKNKRVNVTPHLQLAILQYLISSVKAFHSDNMSPRILQKLLNMDVFREMKIKQKDSHRGRQESVEDDNEGVIITKGKPMDYFVLIIEGRVQITIGQENHKFIEGPFTAFGEPMLEQAMALPISPMMSGDPTRGTSVSLSLHSSVNEVQFQNGRSLKKTNTQVNIDSSGRRAGSADAGIPVNYLSTSKPNLWIPDYNVKFITDGVYLKIRRATYLVALKASRMNHLVSDSGVFNDKELDYALERVTEHDDDEFDFTPNCRSPDKYFDPNGLARSSTATPTTEIRRESLRSSLSMMKSRFMGGHQLKRSSTSIDKSKDEFWDGMTNPALDNHGDNISMDPAEASSVLDTSMADSSPGGIVMNHVTSASNLNSYNTTGLYSANNGKAPLSLPLKQRGESLVEKQANSECLPSPPHTTVISVRGTGAGGPNGGQMAAGGGGEKPSLAIQIPNSDNTSKTTNSGTESETGIESGRTTTTTDNAEFKAGGGVTNKTGSVEPCQMSPNDRTSLLGVNNSVS